MSQRCIVICRVLVAHKRQCTSEWKLSLFEFSPRCGVTVLDCASSTAGHACHADVEQAGEEMGRNCALGGLQIAMVLINECAKSLQDSEGRMRFGLGSGAFGLVLLQT